MTSLKLFLILYYIKQINSKLPCVCSVIDHRGRQNVVRTSMTHSAAPRVPLFCSYPILTSSVIYNWTDARQLGIYLLNIFFIIIHGLYILPRLRYPRWSDGHLSVENVIQQIMNCHATNRNELDFTLHGNPKQQTKQNSQVDSTLNIP